MRVFLGASSVRAVSTKRWGRVCALAASVSMVALSACDRAPGSKPPAVGQAAPQFTISDADHTVSLNQYRGRVVVLNFWASWCPPCLEELPSLTAMSQSAQQRGIVVLAVSEDEDEGAYRKFLTDHHVDMVTVRDPERKAAPMYGTYIYPETYVIDPSGIIRRKFIGATDWTKPEIMESLLRLQSQAPAPSRAAN